MKLTPHVRRQDGPSSTEYVPTITWVTRGRAPRTQQEGLENYFSGSKLGSNIAGPAKLAADRPIGAWPLVRALGYSGRRKSLEKSGTKHLATSFGTVRPCMHCNATQPPRVACVLQR